MEFNPQRVRFNVRRSTTEDLLNRITVYREGMEPEALEIIAEELASRGVTPEQIAGHEAQLREEAIFLPDGVAAQCHFCREPAVIRAWGWHKLWGWIPIFPRLFYYCRQHNPWLNAARVEKPG